MILAGGRRLNGTAFAPSMCCIECMCVYAFYVISYEMKYIKKKKYKKQGEDDKKTF